MGNNWEISYFPDLWRLGVFLSLGYQSFKGVSWALVLGQHLGDTIKGLLLVLGLFLLPTFGLVSWACAPIISNPISYPPSL